MKVEDIELFLKNFMSTWQIARIYELEHPSFIDSVTQTYSSLEVILYEKGELVVGILEDELASGENIFFDLSRKMKAPIKNLKERGIERIVFKKGIVSEELTKFFSFLIAPLEDIKDQPQSYLISKGIKNIEVGKIKGQAKSEKIKGGQSLSIFGQYESCLSKISQSLNTFIDEDMVDFFSLKFIANNIMEGLIGNYQTFFKLIEAKSHDVITFMHLLNVSILATYFSHKLGFKKDDCLAIGTAALFHDIGKLYIERKIIQKPGGLDEAEFAKIKSHTVLGAELLLGHTDALTSLPVVVAFEHHLGYNLEGYPKVRGPYRIHTASLIVSICDIYDALMQRRAYKKGYSPEVVYNIMIQERGKKLSLELLDKFFSIMGVWPIGTIVLLEDERAAIVREVNEDDIFRPKIEIVSYQPHEVIDLKKNEGIKIKRSLNPLDEGRQYIELI
jgi:putative nucleotidyltransferase with HDIG domain